MKIKAICLNLKKAENDRLSHSFFNIKEYLNVWDF